MKDFQAAAPGRLRTLAFGSKLLYSAFTIATLIGLLVSWRLYGAGVGDAGPGAYYAGAASVEKESAAPAAGGPAIQIAEDDAKARVLVEQISERKLLEVTHFHLFSIPVYVLILAHLWLLAKIPVRVQNAGVVLAVLTSGLHIAGPWIVRGHAGLVWLMPVSGVGMLGVMGVMGVWATVDMWLPAPSMAEQLAEMRRMRAKEGGGPPPAKGG